jgi:hypothetical protein
MGILSWLFGRRVSGTRCHPAGRQLESQHSPSIGFGHGIGLEMLTAGRSRGVSQAFRCRTVPDCTALRVQISRSTPCTETPL